MFSIFADGKSIYDPSVDSYFLFQPSLKLEFGKSGSLEFVVPPTNYYYDKFQQLKTVMVVMLDDEEIFRGRVFSIERSMNNFKKVICEGDLSYLVDSVQKAEKYTGKTRSLFTKIIEAHNGMVEAYKRFEIGSVTIDNRDIILTGKDEGQDINVGDIDYKQIAINSMADEWNTTFDYIQNCLIDYCGGYLRTRRVDDVTYIDYLKNYAATNTAQTIEFSKNLLDLEVEASAEDLFTVLVPIGDDNLTIKSVNKNKDEIVDTEAVKKYGRIVRTHVFSNVNNPATLLENGKRYLAENVTLRPTYEVKAIDMHLLDGDISMIHVGDRLRLKSSPHGISEYLVCTAIEYDFSNPENNTYTFGNPKQTLTQRYKEDQRKTNDSAASAAGAAGSGAAKAAAADAKEKADSVIDKIYEEWIDIDPDNPDGIGSLGGLYKLLKDGREVLTQKVGIDFNAKENNISLYALKDSIDKANNTANSAKAAVSAGIKDINGVETAITEMVASYKSEVDGKISEHEATWSVWASEKESVIQGKADRLEIETMKGEIEGEYEKDLEAVKQHLTRKVGIDWDASAGKLNLYTMNKTLNDQGETIRENSTAINQISNDLVSQVEAFAKYKTKNNEKVAKIKLTADANKSAIELKADKVDIDAEIVSITGRLEAAEASIKDLTAEKITTEQIVTKIGLADEISVHALSADSIVSPSIAVSDGRLTYAVATKQYISDLFASAKLGVGIATHYHVMTENVQAGTITLGLPTSTGPQTFDIRATKTYRDGVAAAATAVASISVDPSEEYPDSANKRFISSNKTVIFYRKAIAKDAEHNELYTQNPVAIAVNISDIYNDLVTELNQSQATAIQDAVDAVRITELGKDNDRQVTTVKSGNHYYVSIPVKAKASNGADSNTDLSEQPRTVSADVINIYTEGRQSVDFDATNPIIWDTTAPHTSGQVYNGDSLKTTTIYVKAQIDNNTTSIVKAFTTGTTAFDRGEAVGLKKGQDTYNPTTLTITADPTTDYTKYVITAVAKNKDGVKRIENTYTTSTLVWSKGKATGVTEGRTTYEPTSIAISSSPASNTAGTEDYKKYNITAIAYNKSGTKLFESTSKTSDSVYLRGWNAVTVNKPFRDTSVALQKVYDSASKIYKLRARIKATATNSKDNYDDLDFDGSLIYTQGKTDGASQAAQDIGFGNFTALSYSTTDYDKAVTITDTKYSLSTKKVYGRMQASLTGGSSKTTKCFVYLNAAELITAVENSVVSEAVSISNFVPLSSGSATSATVTLTSAYVYDYQNGYLYGNAKANMSDGTGTNFLIKMAGTKAYEAGQGKAVKDVSISSASITDERGTDDYKKLRITATARDSDNNALATTSKDLGSSLYNRGKNDYAVSADYSTVSFSFLSDDSSSDDYKKYKVTARCRNKYNELVGTFTGTSSASMFNRGKNSVTAASVSGVSSVSIGSAFAANYEVTFSKARTYYENPYVVGHLKVSLDDGSSSNIIVYMHGGTAIDNAPSVGLTEKDLTNSYNSGYAQGYHDGSPYKVTGSTYIAGVTRYIVKKMDGNTVYVDYDPNA